MKTNNRLDIILSENISTCKKRESETFDNLNGTNDHFIVFGSGGLGRKTYMGAKAMGINVQCFADNNENTWNSKIDGLEILSPQNALLKYPDAIVILSIWSDKAGHPLEVVRKQLNDIRVTNVISFIYLFWKYPDTFLPYWRCDLPHKTIENFELVTAAGELWSDEFSRNEYFNQIYWRLYGDFAKMTPPVSTQQYFPDDIFNIKDDEVFVDCGAFDGDTLQSFLSKQSGKEFSHYYAFEPDPANFYKLEGFVQGLSKEIQSKITVNQIAIGACEEEIHFQADSSIQSFVSETGNLTVKSYSIDGLNLPIAPTYLKMDVEGFEPNIIFGAKETIKKYKPIIAISIYHKFDHLWRLPLAIHAFAADYDFYLRPHFFGGWELVCYAVPKNRVKK